MSDKEKKILKNLADTLPKLDECGKSYLLGFGEGLAMKREAQKREAQRRKKVKR